MFKGAPATSSFFMSSLAICYLHLVGGGLRRREERGERPEGGARLGRGAPLRPRQMRIVLWEQDEPLRDGALRLRRGGGWNGLWRRSGRRFGRRRRRVGQAGAGLPTSQLLQVERAPVQARRGHAHNLSKTNFKSKTGRKENIETLDRLKG